MAKGTIIFIFFLTILATLLLGINIGKNISLDKETSIPSPTATATPVLPLTSTPILFSSPTSFVNPELSPSQLETSITTFTDRTCGFSFSYPGSFIRQETTNAQSVIFVNPENLNDQIAAVCTDSIPRPPVSSDKIEAVTIDGVATNLYHDQDQDGNPRDEIIVKHPVNGLEIIIVGYGLSFENAVSSFKFL